jgi:WD40 repeat protein
VLQTLETAEGADITTLAFHPGGDLLAGGSFNHPDAWIWDITTGDLLQTWKYPEDLDVVDRRYDLAFNQEGTHLFSACGLAGLRVWDVEAATEVAGPSEKIEALQVVVAPDGQTLAVSYDDEWWGVCPMVNIVERETWQWHEPFANGNSSSESFSPDGQVLATFGERGNIYLWEVSTGRLLATI